MKPTIRIADRTVGPGHPCFIIAEAGVCHFGSYDMARALVDMAVEAGADAIKFQVFKTERLVSSVLPDWVKRLKPKELPYAAFADLEKYCKEKGIIFFATAHEEESADFLASLDVPVMKVGSGEVDNTPFIRHLAGKGRPLIISTGLHDERAIEEVLRAAASGGCGDVALLHCVTAYPTPPAQANLRSIPWMARKFGCPVGYSDHTLGYEIPLAAVALGATIIEKHISLDKQIAFSQDAKVSCDRADLVAMVRAIRNVEAALGVEGKSVASAARSSEHWARKSVVAARDLAAGTVLAAGDVVLKRPGTGIPPDRFEEVIGRRLARAMSADEVLQWSDLAAQPNA
jgi:N-acetylneuraminate synthase/N,N'-diacetyllegionaminate synthase